MGKILTMFMLLIAGLGIYSWLSGGALERIKAEVATEKNPVGDFFATQLGRPVETSVERLAPATPQVGGARISSGTPSKEDIEEAKQFGDPSPLRGTISFETSTIYTYGGRSAANEYVTLRAHANNTKVVALTGWSLQSAVSGVRVSLPSSGTSTYRMGGISTLSPIELVPGASATIVSGASPLGTSFRTNICSGYLAQFQSFSPSLSNSCPSPSTEMSNTLDNLRTYGASCIDFVKTLPTCTYYLDTFPESVSPACRNFVSNALTYNSCVDRHQFDANFSSGSWRIYLGRNSELWNNAHDVIRLLDESGRTVDVWSY